MADIDDLDRKVLLCDSLSMIIHMLSGDDDSPDDVAKAAFWVLEQRYPDITEQEHEMLMSHIMQEAQRIETGLQTVAKIIERAIPAPGQTEAIESVLKRMAAAGDLEAISALSILPKLRLLPYAITKSN